MASSANIGGVFSGQPAEFPLPTLNCGTFDGSVAASRWLTRLKWDFEKAGHNPQNLPASQVLKTLNMQCEGDAATYLDSVPHLTTIMDKAMDGIATLADLAIVEASLKERFPSKIIDQDAAGGDINSLSQEKDEALLAYYNRALSTLHRVGCKDAGVGITLSMPEKTVLTGLVRQFVRGLADSNLRRQALSMSAMTASSLKSAFTIIRDARQIIDEREAEDRREADLTRARLLEEMVVRQNPGQAVEQLLARQFAQSNAISQPIHSNYGGYFNQPPNPFGPILAPVGAYAPGTMAKPPPNASQLLPPGGYPQPRQAQPAAPRFGYGNQNQGQQYQSFQGNQSSQPGQPQYRDRGAFRSGRDVGIDFSRKDRNLPDLPDRKTSKNPYVNGSVLMRDGDILCIRCGEPNHRRPECHNTPLQPWEQSYIKAMIFPSNRSFANGIRPPVGVVDVHSAQLHFVQEWGYPGNLPPPDFVEEMLQQPQAPQPATTTDELKNPWDPTDHTVGGRHCEFTPAEDDADVVPALTESEEARFVAESKSAGIVQLSEQVAEVMKILVDDSLKPDERVLKINSLVAQAEAAGSSARKKWMDTILQRPSSQVQRIEKSKPKARVARIPGANALEKPRGDIPMADILTPDPVASSPKKKVVRRNGLTTIVAREGEPAIDIRKMAKDIKFNMSLVDLMQLSPEFSKSLRAISQRIVAKRPKKVKFTAPIVADTHLGSIPNPITITKDPKANIKLFSRNYEATRPFRIECTLSTPSMQYQLPRRAAQADQGSEMNIISPRLVDECGLRRHPLSGIGFEGLNMGAASGSTYAMTHFVAVEVTTYGIKREIWACIRPGDSDQSVLLLLGMPWLYDVRALIDPWGAKLVIGDTSIGEQLVEIEGPLMQLSDTQRLILNPASDDTDLVGRDRLRNMVEMDPGDSDDNEDDDNEDASDADEEMDDSSDDDSEN
ncbi:hypothetical protein CH63R_09248 [Colletotrichum higginsianum IMI 349063]|uniref:CCHC-type domain-containing protein n=3 Tax=Colletotrichum higginsianum (strain IMI 349063) TaxID=759273 RepID=A0A1B7XT57_COLHI|nr:hypothetical protein CH63R_14153 [Colletotrichum higginsianum IMI 349063]XP_018156245.1 hypothetical protein CH63R_09248 [Colletotrichum higginsianum IMI 349063]OBR02927.1 hypothetical protein CH63R_14153 [Colletotrichum higginsianum IMI 349063]OBR07727.1 hypothetical protein CH63R_09248 [Colletotrichum higginsianum IMI 349063]